MIRFLTILLVACSFQLSAFSQDQQGIRLFRPSNSTTNFSHPAGNNIRGVYGFGQNPTSFEPEWRGYHLTVEWQAVETSSGVYNWTSTDADINHIIVSGGILCTVQFQFGPQCPQWLMTSAQAGSYTTHGGNDNGPYPRYYHPNYKKAYYAFLRKIAQHLLLFPEIVAWQVCEGSTGDEGPHKGTLDPAFVGDNPDYVPNGTDAKWLTFRKAAWDSANKYIGATANQNLHMLINAGNSGENLEYVHARFPTAFIKEGRSSHAYMFDGQNMYLTRPEILSRGEVQGTIFNTQHPEKDAFALAVSVAALGLGIFNTAPGWYTQMVQNDLRPDKFFNKYANDTIAFTSNKAFICISQPIGLDDIVRYPETPPYGPVIQPSKLTAYNNQISNINNSSDGESYKAYRRIQILNAGGPSWTYFNPARETAIRAANAGNGSNWAWIADANNVDNYGNDYIFGAIVNYNKWVTQLLPYTNTEPLYKVAPDTSIYGRFAGQFHIQGGAADMTFDIDNNWSSSTNQADVYYEITYKNSGTGTWALYANQGSGMGAVATFTNTNSGQWAKKSGIITSMVLGTAQDFKLHYVSGANTIFTLVQLENTTP